MPETLKDVLTVHLTMPMWLRSKQAGANLLLQLLKHTTNGWKVWRQIKTGEPVTRLDLRGGPTIYARPKEDNVYRLFWEIMVERSYTTRDFYWPMPDHTIVDIGANIGVFALECQRIAPGVRIHAVEPSPGTFAQLQQNLLYNRLDASITPYRLAVSDHHGSPYLKPGAETSAHQELISSGNGDPIPCVTLDKLFTRAH